MRILQVTAGYPPQVGGLEYHVESLSLKLAEAGHAVVVYAPHVSGAKNLETANGVETHRFRPLAAPLNNPLMLGLLKELLRGPDFDVIHAHGYLQVTTNMCALRRVCKPTPLVITSHGAVLGYKGWRGVIESSYHRTLGRWTLGLADRVIALSSTQGEILRGLGAAAGKVVVIPNWMDVSEFHAEDGVAKFRETYQLGGSRVVLFVGRLQPRKGVEYLVDAMRYMKSQPKVVVIGDELPAYQGSRERLERQAEEYGLKERLIVVGNLSREDLMPAYVGADVFVLPSLAEGMPIVLLEAMASGTCVVATDIPGNRDLVRNGENGVLVEPRNAAELAHQIDFLLNNDDIRLRLGAQARRDVEENYSPGAVLNRIVDVYREVQESKRS